MINTLTSYEFPDELVLNKEKDKLSFGEKYASAIWSKEEGALNQRSAQFKKNQLYADMKHPIDECRNRIQGKFIEAGFLKIDWNSRVPFLHDQLHKVYNSVDFTEFTPMVYAIDPTARDIKKKRKDSKIRLLAGKDFITEMAQITGDSPIPLDSIPQSKEQIEVEEETAKPLDIETAEELVLKGISVDNIFEEIQRMSFKDVNVKGVGVGKVYTDPTEGLKIEYVSPNNWIFSPTKDRFFRDCNYFAEVRYISVGELKKIARSSDIVITDEIIKELMMNSSVSLTDQTKVKVLYYNFKTFHKTIYKAKTNRDTGKLNLNDRSDDDYQPKGKSDISKRVEDVYDVWYEGILTLTATKKILRHRLVENLSEYKGKIFPPYMAYAPRMNENGFNSLVEKKIGAIDKMQELDFRIQHMRNELKGNITRVNPDSFTRVKLGDRYLKPEEVLSFYFTKYIAFDITKDADGDDISMKTPLTEVPSGIPYALRELASDFATEYNQFLRSFGYAGADDQKPDAKSLWETEPYRLSDNNSLKDLSDCAYFWSVLIMQNCSARLNDAIQSKHLRDKYVAMIGTDDIEVIEKYRSDRINHYYGIYMDYIPTREERMLALQDIDVYVKERILSPVDAMELRNTRNTKLAIRILNLKIEVRRKQEQENKMADSQQMQNGNIQASNVASENKLKIIEREAYLKNELAEAEFKRKYELLKAQGETDLQLESIRANTKGQVEEYRKNREEQLAVFKKDKDEDIRLKGIRESAKFTSRAIEQRQGNVGILEPESNQPEVDLSQI